MAALVLFAAVSLWLEPVAMTLFFGQVNLVSVFGAHAAAQDDGIVAQAAQGADERGQVGGPVGEDEAVPAPGQGLRARRR